MSNKRISQINELIRSKLAEIICYEIEMPLGSLVTIKNVETTSDLRQAKVWLSILPVEYQIRVFNLLNKKIYFLQKNLDRKLVMKFVPKIAFYIDQSEEEADRINRLLDKIKK